MAAAYDNYQIGAFGQFNGFFLAVLGGLANGVGNLANVGVFFDFFGRFVKYAFFLGGLGNDVYFVKVRQAGGLFRPGYDNPSALRIAQQADYFGVATVAYDNGVVALFGKFGNDVLRVFYKRAGSVHHFHSAGFHFLLELRRNAVGADDQHAGFIGRVLRTVNGGDLLGSQHIGHLFVVNQGANGVDRLFAGGFQFQHFVYGALYARAKARAFGNGDVLFFFHTYIIGN